MSLWRLRTWRMVAWVLIICLMPMMGLSEVSVRSAPLSRSAEALDGMVRVFLSSMGNPSQLDITVQGSYSIGGDTSKVLKNGDQVTVKFNSSTGKLTLTRNGSTTDMGSAFTLTRHSANVNSGLLIAQSTAPKNPYPGDVKFEVQKSGTGYKLYTIVSVYIENYLYGVVPYEMGNGAPLEALKAQAVAARTYTLNRMNQRAGKLYDVVDTTNDQVYRGTPSGNANCRQAIDETKGIVAMSGSNLISTYYTASNGGQTESSANAWGSSGLSYLIVKDDPFDLAASGSAKRKLTVYETFSHGSQSTALTKLIEAKALDQLKDKGYQTSGAKVLKITNVVPHTPKFNAPSRLYTQMDFYVTAQAKKSSAWQNVNLTLTFDIFSELESALGMSINAGKNELWSVERDGDTFVLAARRHGHGVGLSQNGAMEMARRGYSYAEILGFYYTGVKRMQYSFTHTILSPVGSGASSTITTTEKPAELEADSSACTAVVALVNKADQLGLRAKPSPEGMLIGAVPNGAPVKVYSAKDGWALIGYGQLKGYALVSGLKLNGEAPKTTEETPSPISKFAYVTANISLNLRDEPNFDSNVIKEAPNGALLAVYSVSGSWAKVQYGNLTAYASTDYMRFISEYPYEVTDPANKTAVVTLENTGETVNLRKKPATDSDIIKKLAHGTQVQVVTSDGSWCQVVYKDQTGYIMADYLKLSGSAEEPDITPPAADEETFDLYAKVVTESGSLNLRSKAQAGSNIKTTIPRNTRIGVISRGDTWSKVSYKGTEGYVMTQFLAFEGDAEPEIGEWTARVTTLSGSLNLRKEAKAGSTILTRIPQGTSISVLEKGAQWSKVTYDGHTGYVMNSFLTFVPKGEADQAPDTTPDTGTGTEPDTNPDGDPDDSHTLYARVTTASGSLNLRKKPESGDNILTRIPRNEQIVIWEKQAKWSKTTYGGHTGYVMNQYLTFLTDAEAPDTEKPETSAPEDATPESTMRAWVNTVSGSLNLRKNAKQGADLIRTIPQYAEVAVLDKGSTWCKVTYQGSTGYVMTQFLSFNKVNNEIEEETTPSTAVYAWVDTENGKSLNLRNKPNGDRIGSIPNGQRVTVLEKGSTWYKIVYGGQTGYVKKEFLSDQSQAAPDVNPPAEKPDHNPALDSTLEVLETPVPAKITADGGLHLRVECDANAKSLVLMPQGDYVLVLEQGDTWCYVGYEGENGYCMTSYLKMDPA